MSLIECPECHKNISDTAQSCPNCGCKISNKKPLLLIILAAIGGIIGILVLLSGISDLSKAENVSVTSINGVEETTYDLTDNYYLGLSDFHVL